MFYQVFVIFRKEEEKDEQKEAFKDLESDSNIGYIQITSVLTFDDLVDQFRMERYQ